VLGVALVAVVLWGGYSHRWPWTGINGHTATLWDWLHLLLLPVAVSVLPIWMRREARLDPALKRASLAGMTTFALVVLAGYLIPWAWTGFVGNRLWDWLNLIALPFAIALIPLLPTLRESWTGRHTAVSAAALAVFVAVVLGGYLGSWAWTGFTGNTLWDWLHLLLLPLLLPTVVVPSLTPLAERRMVPVEGRRAADGPAEAAKPAASSADAKPAPATATKPT
jgi:hypothetical protein